MTLKHPDYWWECKHLEDTCKMLESEIYNKDNEINNYKSEIVSIRKNMWENARHGFGTNETEEMIEATQYIAAMKNEENSYRFTKAMLDKYRKLLSSPYFARVDFQEIGEPAADRVYIGQYSFINRNTMEVVIHDWRAPVSSVFYEFEPGPAAYRTSEASETIDGMVHGEVSVKRQFKIKDSKLLYMFDSSVKIDDEILQEILSGNASEKMKSIVTTIQKEQNRVIRYDEGSMLVVQGAAGSGKTSIALHRIAYLLYKDRNLSSNNIVIFSPSQIFNDYISNVLPELGEENVIQTTFAEHGTKLAGRGLRIESFNDHMDYLLSTKAGHFDRIREKGYLFKNSRVFLDALRGFTRELADRGGCMKDVYYKGRLAIKGSELRTVYNRSDSSLPVNKRLAAARERAFYLLAKVQEVKKSELRRKADSSNSSAREAALKVKMELKSEFAGVKDEIDRMTRVELHDSFRSFFASKSYYEAGKAFGLTDAELEAISSYTTENLDNRYVNYEDSIILVYLKSVIDIMPAAKDIKHVVIDEAQDYSPLQFEIMRRLYPESSYTILGDMNQMMNPHGSTVDFESIGSVFGREDAVVVRLNKSYRSTREISEFTKAMLPSDKQIDGINRAGKLPEVVRLSDDGSMKKQMTADIKKFMDRGMGSIAILCKNSEDCRLVYKLLSSEIELNMVTEDEDLYKKGVNILPAYLCKGLEFDAVLVYGTDAVNYNTGGDRKLLYTLCTRALHYLKIYFKGNLTPIIAEINKEFYRYIEA